MGGKFGVLFAVLVTVFLITKILANQRRYVERTLSKSARKGGEDAPTLEKDPETGKYRARNSQQAQN